jgi:hypothetical protein
MFYVYFSFNGFFLLKAVLFCLNIETANDM